MLNIIMKIIIILCLIISIVLLTIVYIKTDIIIYIPKKVCNNRETKLIYDNDNYCFPKGTYNNLTYTFPDESICTISGPNNVKIYRSKNLNNHDVDVPADIKLENYTGCKIGSMIVS